MSFEKLVGNEKTKEVLKNVIKSKNILHSYIFVGPTGIGKKEFAKEFAKMILCKNNNTDNCSSCIKFESNNHPDFNIIERTESSIKIEQIREMLSKLLERPIVSNKKIYIIDEAEYMTKEAQNSLLKTLEEPPEFATIILIVENENLLLNTIKSRCTKIVFNKIEDQILQKYLEDNHNIQNTNETLLKLYNGSIAKAIELQDKKEIYEQVEKLILNIDKNDMIDMLNSAEIIYKSKDDINNILDYINIIVYSLSKKDVKYINCINIVEEAKRRTRLNVNFDMNIDNLLISIWEEINEKNSRS